MERLIQEGRVQAKHSSEIQTSRMGIGFEKLDRDVFDPDKAYDRVAELGVKWVRIQSGWAKTEKVRGVYDFAWLDRVVDNLIKRGLKPWLCLCYGNALYDQEAGKIFGAVGIPPICTKEDQEGWENYVRATVRHFTGRIGWYEIWNEPDLPYSWNQKVNAAQYGQFALVTARAVRQADPEAKIVGGAFCLRNLHFVDEALAVGLGEAVDALSFHEYTADETKIPETVRCLGAIGRCYNPKMRVIQGESGSQSRSDGAGALAGGSWTPFKQAKQLLRHTVMDLSTEVLFTSYFSCMDMIEGLNGRVADKASYLDYAYFGVLGADFDQDGHSVGTYTPKPSYYALQNLASLFAEEVYAAELPVERECLESKRIFGMDCMDPTIITRGFRKPNGSAAYAYWNATNLMTTTCESTLSFKSAGLPGKVRLVDPMSGIVYRLPEAMCEACGENRWQFKNLPLLDYPLLLTFGEF